MNYGIEPHRSKLPLERPQFEEAPTLAGESLSTTTECETYALIRPERAQSKLPQNQAFVRTRSRCRHRNSFDFAARLVCGVRTVHPVSRVFRSASRKPEGVVYHKRPVNSWWVGWWRLVPTPAVTAFISTEWFVGSLFVIIFEWPTIVVQKSGEIEKLSVSVTLCG